ncbi:hypothetical protein RB594_008974 [Gaeumannomyces avenae]
MSLQPEIAPEKGPAAARAKDLDNDLKKGDDVQTKAVHNAEFFAAVQEFDLPTWSKEALMLYFSVFVAFCCACANGYDGSLMTGIIAMDPFQEQFKVGKVGVEVGVIYSLYTVGSMVGAPFAAILADRYGRRKGMFFGGIVINLGMIIVSTSSTVAQFIVGRFVLGVGISIMTVAAPSYAVEIAPPHWRGRATGFYNCGWFGGSIPAAAVVFGSNFMTGNMAWRLPLILQAAACLIVMASVWFIPESPRWLMAQGREAEAIDFLVKYHGNNNRESRMVKLEVEEMREGIKLDGIDKVWWDYRPLFMTHSGRWRMTQVLMISIFGQYSGNGLGYFNAQIFEGIGVKTSAQQLGYNLLNSVLSAIGALTAVYFTDRMPRRPVLIFGTMCCSFMLAINSGLSAKLAEFEEQKVFEPSYGAAALWSYFMFNIIFSFTYTPLQGAIPTEALETTMRAKGLALSGIIVSAIGFINQFCTPIALESIQYRYIFIFVGWDLIEALCWYLFGVESHGRTLEQLEWVYNQPSPVKASLKVEKIVLANDGRVVEVLEDSA